MSRSPSTSARRGRQWHGCSKASRKDRIFIKDSTSVGVDLYHEGAEYQRPFTVWYNGEQVTTDNEAERPRPFYLLAEEKLINKVSFMVCVPPVTIPPRELVYMLSYGRKVCRGVRKKESAPQ